MSTKPVFPTALLLALLGATAAPGQDYSAPPGPPPGTPEKINMLAPDEMPPPTRVDPPLPPSKWVTYTCPECCGPVGGDGPIHYELFVRTGPALHVGGGVLSSTTSSSWWVSGGGRSLFYNVDRTAAWTAELGLGYVGNDGNRQTLFYQQEGKNVSTASVKRTYAIGGLGREWYLLGAAQCGTSNWRVGADAGYRYGTTRLDVHDFNKPAGLFTRYNGIVAGPYISAHTDYEIPWNCCTSVIGFRAEWDYQFTNMIPGQNGDIIDVNLLFNLGVRY